MAFEAYSVAVKLSLTNMVSSGLAMIAKDLTGLEKNVVNLQDKFKALKMIGVGWGMSKAGSGMLGFLEHSVDASKEYTRQLSLMNAAGMDHLEIAQATAAAWKTSKNVITSTAAGNLATITELRSAFGRGEGMQHAYAMLPTVQRVESIVEALTGKAQHKIGFDMVKAIEFSTKGAVTVPEMQKQSEMMTKALVAFGGTLSVSDFHQTLKASKSAAPFLSDEFKYTVLPTIMQEMKSGNGGAQAAGTAIATLFGTVKGHAIMKRQIGAWVDGGLILPGMVKRDPHHQGTDKIMPGGIAGENLFTQNPEAWAVKYLAPARDRLMKKYHMDEIGAYYSLTGNRNTAFMFQTLVNKGAQFARDKELINQVGSSYTTYQKLLGSNPQLAQQALHSQWENVQARIGYEILPRMIPYMIKFADGLDRISQWMESHPTKFKALVFGFGGLGVAMDVFGRILMTAGIIKLAGFGSIFSVVFGRIGSGLSWLIQSPFKLFGWGLTMMAKGLNIIINILIWAGRLLLMTPIGLTITAIAGIAYLLWRNWNTVKPKLLAIWDWSTNAVSNLWTSIKNGFNTFVSWFLHGWQNLFNNLIDGMNGILPASMAVGKMSFADVYDKSVAPVPNSGKTTTHVTYVLLDGKKVAESVTSYQERAASRPLSASSAFDPTRAQPFPGLKSLQYGG